MTPEAQREGMRVCSERNGPVERTTVTIETERAAQTMQRPCGQYVTLGFEQAPQLDLELRDALQRELAAALAPLLGGVYRGAAADVFTALGENPALAGRAFLIPYSAVGSRGLLAAVRPDYAAVDGEARELLLAIAPEPLAGGFDAIIPADL